ncbi:antitoxin [Mycobacterium sp.]|uniref:antitoxin n=1 Tax=Mycobacterium sp. TaxID=1785 RepID=UPI0031D3FF2C
MGVALREADEVIETVQKVTSGTATHPAVSKSSGGVPRSSHASGMNRTRLSTTVDAAARRVRSGVTDATLIDEALQAFLASHRAAEVDASYAAYDTHPADEPDAWGDLASWRRAAAIT